MFLKIFAVLAFFFFFNVYSSPLLIGNIILPMDETSMALYMRKMKDFPYRYFDILYVSSVKVYAECEVIFRHVKHKGFLKEIIREAHRYNVKVMLSIGGPVSADDHTFFDILLKPMDFQEKLESFLEEYGLDGVNIAGSFNPNVNAIEKIINNYRASPKTKEKLINSDVNAEAIIYPNLFSHYNFINILSYTRKDIYYMGDFNYTYEGYHRFMKKEKMLVGINFQGYLEEGVDVKAHHEKLRLLMNDFRYELMEGVIVYNPICDGGMDGLWEGLEIVVRVLGKIDQFKLNDETTEEL